MGLSVTVLGCCGSYAGPGGACSGYLVQAGGASLWVDAGAGTLANLQRHVAVDQVDAVLLSHEHPDHWSDFEGFYVARRYVHDGPQPRGLPVYAPSSLREHLYFDELDPWFAWRHVTDGDRVEVAGMAVTFSRTDHGPETLAMRFDVEGKSLGYSADSGPGWSLEALGSGLDAALCEASFQREQEGMAQHLSARQAGETARAAGVARLLLTHIWPTLDPARSRAEGADAFGADVEVVEHHGRYEL